MAVAAVNVKLLPFRPSDPQIWFAQVEAQFTTRGITVQKTKFDYIVASLAPEFTTEVRDLVLAPPVENPYDTLKEQLIKRTAASEQCRLQQLFNAEELGDRKSTQLLRRMQQLLGDKAGATDGSFLKELLLQCLPSNVRMVLASTGDAAAGLEELAQLADKIVEVATPSVSAVTHQPHLKEELDQLLTKMIGLKKLVRSLSSRDKPFRGRSPSPARPRSPADASLCWYHQKLGDAARQCREPCSKLGNALASH